MRVVENELNLFIDVDDTLVMWGKEKNPFSVGAMSPYDGTIDYLQPHVGHIKILKDRKARGSHITVWSAGGYRWALAVIQALQLESYVDMVMSKPFAYLDDKVCTEWMGERVYLKADDKYGQTNNPNKGQL